MTWWSQPIAPPSTVAREAALRRQSVLTKPPGSLGKLESLAVTFAGWQGRERPILDQIVIRVFAADHGVAREGVSAFPQAVTAAMLHNFAAGGAAINVLARQYQADFAVVNVGVVADQIQHPSIVDALVAPGSDNMCEVPALSRSAVEHALSIGAAEVRTTAHLFVGGEMGIANTTSAAALASAYLQLDPSKTVGRGTGIAEAALGHKRAVVERALSLHRQYFDDPLETLRRVGGIEIAALAGAYIGSAMRGVPSLVDGYVATAAATAACRLNAALRPWLLFSHLSAEPGHRYLLADLDATPLLEFDLRLGEGSGAALALGLLRSACLLHNEMATFESTNIAPQGDPQ